MVQRPGAWSRCAEADAGSGRTLYGAAFGVMKQATCRFCGEALKLSFADLGMSPPSNSYFAVEDLGRMERFYPLHAWVCSRCFLVQLEQFETPEQIFGDYAYFSSYSDSWLAHARNYTQAMRQRFQLGRSSFVVEIASNDGYLL